MRIHVVLTYFREFRLRYYADPRLPPDVGELLRLRCDWAYDLATCLPPLGVRATLAVANDPLSQSAWALGHGAPFSAADLECCARYLARDSAHPPWWRDEDRGLAERIVLAQVAEAAPDVTLYTNAFSPSRPLREETRRLGSRVVVQCTQPLEDLEVLRPADLVMTVSAAREARYREGGIPTRRFRYGFNPAVLREVGGVPRGASVVFVGQLSARHVERRLALAELAGEVPVEWYGPEADAAGVAGALRDAYRGEAFGLEMYRVLAGAAVGWNHPPDFEPNLFGMFRPLEVMGCGTPLVTRASDAGYGGFVSGHELRVFEDVAEAAAICRALLDDRAGAAELGARGQRRVLEHHSAPEAVADFLDAMRDGLRI